MTRAQADHTVRPETRRTPVVHTEALQEAKRIEKMQTVCSSHRTSGTATLPVIIAKTDAAR